VDGTPEKTGVKGGLKKPKKTINSLPSKREATAGGKEEIRNTWVFGGDA